MAREASAASNRATCALFDLDGTMCHSDPVHFVVFDELARRTGVLPGGMTEEYFKANIAGGANESIFARMFPERSVEERARMADEKEAEFRERLKTEHLERAGGLTELLNAFDRAGVKTCVVTNAPRENAEAMLERLGLREYFGERLVIGTECARSKPHPDPYLEGMRRCGVEDASACVAFEDSPTGARAAVAAKIPTVGILSSQSEETLTGAGCFLCVADFTSPALASALGIETTTATH